MHCAIIAKALNQYGEHLQCLPGLHGQAHGLLERYTPTQEQR